MRLAHYELNEPFEIQEGIINTLEIENPRFLRRIISELVEQSFGNPGGFCLSDDNKIIELSKTTEIITDIFNLVFDSRSLQNKVYQAVSSEFLGVNSDVEVILSDINELAGRVVSKLDFPAKFNELTNAGSIIKLLNFSIDTDNMDFCERLIDYIGFMNDYLNRKLFIILNLKSFLTKEEQNEFFKIIQYKKINIFLIENTHHDRFSNNEKIRIIDKDLCEI